MENKKIIKWSIALSFVLLVITYTYNAMTVLQNPLLAMLILLVAPGSVLGMLASHSQADVIWQIIAGLTIFISNAVFYFIFIKICFWFFKKIKKPI